jgi:type I restriction enzyme R subunit
VIAAKMGELAGTRFALIVDEAHSSQSGESIKKLKQVLAAGTLEEAEREESEDEEEDLEDRIVAEMRQRGRLTNASTFAFTATPKSKTLELFGTRGADGTYAPFSLYTMRQAIEEGFILDVLQNYTTYKVYWNLLKKIQDDPHYDRAKASYLMQSFVGLHEHAVGKKVEVMVEHFHQKVAGRIKGRAKAMVVTRSRLHAVRFRVEFDRYLREKGYPYKALVAFSGEVKDGAVSHSEANMNGVSESQTARTFERPEYRFLIVANKFQTGFDQPLLHTMYVDKKLGGVQAVQTLSRLNRTAPGKTDTMVLDFANESDEIQKAFQPYYEKTILSEGTDPNLLYDLHRALLGSDVFTASDVEAFARLFFGAKTTQEQLYAAIDPIRDRFKALRKEDQAVFRSRLNDYVRLYAFLSQLLTFTDSDLEKLYVFARLLRRRLPPPEGGLPVEVQEAIDMASYRIEQKTSGRVTLERGKQPLEPLTGGAVFGQQPERLEPLSQIIRELNEKFGTDFREKDKVVIRQLEERLSAHESLADSIRVNTPENARLTFESVVTDQLQDLANTNFEFYNRVTDDDAFARHFLNWLFERVQKSVRS